MSSSCVVCYIEEPNLFILISHCTNTPSPSFISYYYLHACLINMTIYFLQLYLGFAFPWVHICKIIFVDLYYFLWRPPFPLVCSPKIYEHCSHPKENRHPHNEIHKSNTSLSEEDIEPKWGSWHDCQDQREQKGVAWPL